MQTIYINNTLWSFKITQIVAQSREYRLSVDECCVQMNMVVLPISQWYLHCYNGYCLFDLCATVKLKHHTLCGSAATELVISQTFTYFLNGPITLLLCYHHELHEYSLLWYIIMIVVGEEAFYVTSPIHRFSLAWSEMH